jgi:hypothetical protein
MKTMLFAVLALVPVQLFAADTLTNDQKEAFLKTAKIISEKPSKKGITGTVRVTMTDGKITHDASVQRIDDHQAIYQTASRTEFNFKDTYVFDVTGWKLAKMLGLEDMVPPYVVRAYKGMNASFSWWVEDVLMDEEERMTKKINPPDPDSWNKEIQVWHVYTQLIYDTDANATNLLIDKQWHIWMIDHSRAFRIQKTLMDPKALSICDRNLLAKMKALDAASLEKEMKSSLDKGEIQGLLARRDLIVKFFEAKGDSALYDRPSRN